MTLSPEKSEFSCKAAQRLSSFREIERSGGRGDTTEGAVLFPLDSEIRIWPVGKEEDAITITKDDLVSPVVFLPNSVSSLNIYCMSAAYVDEDQELTDDNLEDYKNRLKLPARFSTFGSHTVLITNTKEFLKRVKNAVAREGYELYGDMVEYYDPEVGTPAPISKWSAAFDKSNVHQWMREFRLAIDTGTEGDNHVDLHIGRIDDIAVYNSTSAWVNPTISLQRRR